MSSPPGSEITTGTTLRSRISGAGYTVEGLLGAGGQGQVWRVVAAAGSSQPYAVKWYFPQSATPEQFAALQKLVQSGSPNRRFLWPLEMLESDVGGFGYVMELRGEEYCGMTDVINRKIEPTFRALATAGFQLADSFLQLHSKGLCYMDISFGNVFVEPDSGAVLVCDNDNVRVDGQPASVAGTHKVHGARGDPEPGRWHDAAAWQVHGPVQPVGPAVLYVHDASPVRGQQRG